MQKNRLLGSAAALGIVFMMPGAALAADAQAVADAITAQMAAQGIKLAIGSAESDGDDIVFKDVGITPTELETAKVGEIVLEDVTENGSGYIIGRVAAPAFTTEKEGMTLDFGGAEINGLQVPGPDETDPIRKLMLASGASLGPVKVSDGSGEIFHMDGGSMTMSPYEPGGTMTYEAAFTGLFVDTGKLPDEKSRMTMAALGYETLSGNITYAGLWDTTDGRMTIDEMVTTVDDAAALKIVFDISGYTPQFVAALQDMQMQMAEGKVDQQAQGLAMLGLMQQLTFNKMQVRIEDASLTGKLLDFFAAQQGVDRNAMVQQTKGVLPFMLAQLNNPEFAAKVTAAVGAYLDDPKSLTITAAPATPVPAAQIMAAGMSAPQSIPDVLGVTVTAND